LRERKKLRTRSAIQHEALKLFRRKGYENTTVSEIAEAAEVSESTFFRYFGSKEALVFQDDFDDLLIEAFERQPPGLTPLQAIRAAIREGFAGITPEEAADAVERMDLVMRVPELREAVAGELLDSIDRVAALCAPRMRLAADDIRVRALAGGVVGAMLAAFLTPGGLEAGFAGRIDEALGALESGFGQLEDGPPRGRGDGIHEDVAGAEHA
jgi:AcrR family transcriptional regulator